MHTKLKISSKIRSDSSGNFKTASNLPVFSEKTFLQTFFS